MDTEEILFYTILVIFTCFILKQSCKCKEGYNLSETGVCQCENGDGIQTPSGCMCPASENSRYINYGCVYGVDESGRCKCPGGTDKECGAYYNGKCNINRKKTNDKWRCDMKIHPVKCPDDEETISRGGCPNANPGEWYCPEGSSLATDFESVKCALKLALDKKIHPNKYK